MGTKMFMSSIAYSLLRYRGACVLLWPARFARSGQGMVTDLAKLEAENGRRTGRRITGDPFSRPSNRSGRKHSAAKSWWTASASSFSRAPRFKLSPKIIGYRAEFGIRSLVLHCPHRIATLGHLIIRHAAIVRRRIHSRDFNVIAVVPFSINASFHEHTHYQFDMVMNLFRRR